MERLHRLRSESSTLAKQQQQPLQSDENAAKNASTQASFKHQLTDFHKVQKYEWKPMAWKKILKNVKLYSSLQKYNVFFCG